MLNPIRVGKFTSSEIYKLMLKGRGDNPSVTTLSYIEEKAIEQKLGRVLNTDTSARATIWGKTLETRVNSMLDPLEYEYCSDQTIEHTTINSWVGTPDFLTVNRVCDAKCPFTLKSFAKLADIVIAGDVERFKKESPEYYWQLVSNSILANKSQAELIVYCPYKSELQALREQVENVDDNQNKLAWIYFSEDDDLPYLIEGGYYKNLYSFSFDVPRGDRLALTSAVLDATKKLGALTGPSEEL